MGLLRKADLNDFDSFKRIYDDEDNKGYQWLYWDFKPLYEPRDPTEKEKAEFELEFGDILKQLEEEKNSYTIEKFAKDLEKDYMYYFMIERDFQVVGYIVISHMVKGDYRIGEWTMFDYQNENLKKQILDELLEMYFPRIKTFSICAPAYLSVILSLWDLGFRPTGSIRSGFWSIDSQYTNESKKKFLEEGEAEEQ